jgi:hypothetical protein
VLGGVFFLIFLATPQYPSDGEMVEMAVRKGVEEVLPIHLLTGDIFIYEEGREHPRSWLVKRGISKTLKDMGYRVFYEQGNGNRILYYRVGRVDISYRKIGSFFSKKFEREAFAQLYLTLMGDNGEILWIGELESSVRDTVDENLRKFLYTEGLSPEIPYSQGNLIESVLATLAIGALIITLYTTGE